MESEKLAEILAGILDVDKKQITREKNLFDDLGADSFDLVAIAAAIGKEFGVGIPTEEIASIRTVGDFLAFLGNAGK